MDDQFRAMESPQYVPYQQEMTLRDYFAAQAITGKADDANKNFIARRAYELADAMLAERGNDEHTE